MRDRTAPLRGQTALVTGGAKRIGRAIVLALAEAGADVAIHYHTSGAEAEATAGEARARGVRAELVRGDLLAENAAETIFDGAGKALGPPTVLVNNASLFRPGRLVEMTEAGLREEIRLHAWAPFALIRRMHASVEAGVAVNLLDARIVDCDREHAAYHVSKRMLFTLTRMLAVELAPRLRVNAVAPGLVLPPPGGDASYLEARRESNPLRAHGCAEDVAEAVRYLVAAPFVTGQVLFVDGGRHLRGSLYGV